MYADTVTITEPMTMATDYILAASAFGFGHFLLRSAKTAARTALLWPIGFFCGAAAALIGGTFHGFAALQSAATHKALWDGTMLLIGASAGFMVSAALAGPLKRNAENTQWLRAGLFLSVAGLLIQLSGISFAANFNHNDLYHCLQAVAFYFFFRGARLTV